MKRTLALLVAMIAARQLFAGPIAVPIYIEDNHAGSFHWLAQHLDLEEPCTLLLFDAHSDASGVFDSDLIRSQIRRVASRAERSRLLERWREKGVIQCFSWIEPLMPAPIAEVIWVPRDRLDDEGEAQRLADEAGSLLDGQLEAAPRAAGALRPRFHAMDLAQVRAHLPRERPVIATIDLDYFAGLRPAERAAAFERIWSYVAELRNLRAITLAVSRPYLKDDEEADALVELALRAALSLPTASIQFEPFRTVANDRSTRANEYRAQKRGIPSFDVTRASPALRGLLLGNTERIVVREEEGRWKNLLERWAAEAPLFRLAVKDRQPSTDRVWRVPAKVKAQIELRPEPWYAPVERVEWIVQLPRDLRCNLTAVGEDEPGFAQGAPPRPRWREVALSDSGTTLPFASLREFFDQSTGCGALRVRARVETARGVRETPAIEIRRFAGTGFRAALTEQFGLPYLFGSGALRSPQESGPETGWGADCANFLIYALRRQGARIPWSNPRQFRQHLEPVALRVTVAEQPHISEEDLERGIFLHFDTHVAALMEDRPPLGVLNSEDVIAHQLEGAPALISVAELLRSRGKARFDLLRVPATPATTDLIIGGDVMLGRTVGEQIKAGGDPFAGIRTVLDPAGIKAVNLECVLSDRGIPAPHAKFPLRAPVEAAEVLSAAGIDIVGGANNHAADFGTVALLDSIRRLQAAGRVVIGAGRNLDEAYAFRVLPAKKDAPDSTASGSRQVGFISVSDVDLDQSGGDTDGVVAQASKRQLVARSIAKARAEADFVVALVHWGEENSALVTERQRELARWLVDRGVDLVAGSHPHCLQPLDFYRGRPIAYSLGNLVFDGAPTVSSWNRGALLEVKLGARRQSASVRLVPVQLDQRGFPQLPEREGQVR